jgi:hypothetical protein
MAKSQLKESMLEAVENQTRLNDPKCTKETFKRPAASAAVGMITMQTPSACCGNACNPQS